MVAAPSGAQLRQRYHSGEIGSHAPRQDRGSSGEYIHTCARSGCRERGGGDSWDSPRSHERRAGAKPALPTLRVVPNPRVAQFARVESIGWTLPTDDTSFRIYVAGRVKNSGDIGRMRSKFNGKFWWDMTEEEHQKFPGDYEAQVGQGPVTVHSEEHFGQSDRGILLIRRMLSEQLEAMEAGSDPIGVSFDASAPPVEFEAGNYIRRG